MLRKAGILLIAAALGTGAAIGLAACGEDREGELNIETSGTGTTGTGTTGTVGTETAPTETVETVTEFETAPETESGGGATAPETESDDGGTTAP